VSRTARLTAALTGCAREVGPIEAHERTVLAVAAKIERGRRRLRELTREVERLRKQLRHDRREFRALLQRNSSVTEEQLELAGRADGVDRAVALADARPRGVVERMTDEGSIGTGPDRNES
jgi:chromosome segregation ATPase